MLAFKLRGINAVIMSFQSKHDDVNVTSFHKPCQMFIIISRVSSLKFSSKCRDSVPSLTLTILYVDYFLWFVRLTLNYYFDCDNENPMVVTSNSTLLSLKSFNDKINVGIICK
ncbi:Uncharacterised protein at_DN1871 [Pycnogonum litorale]